MLQLILDPRVEPGFPAFERLALARQAAPAGDEPGEEGVLAMQAEAGDQVSSTTRVRRACVGRLRNTQARCALPSSPHHFAAGAGMRTRRGGGRLT